MCRNSLSVNLLNDLHPFGNPTYPTHRVSECGRITSNTVVRSPQRCLTFLHNLPGCEFWRVGVSGTSLSRDHVEATCGRSPGRSARTSATTRSLKASASARVRHEITVS